MLNLNFILLVGIFIGIALIVRFVITKDVREHPE